MRSHLIAGLLAASGLACSEGSVGGSTPASTSTVAPAPEATATATPAATPIPSANFSRANVVEPGGIAPLSREGETVVDPAASFEVELEGRLTDARLVLIDAADAHVPATHTREVGAKTRLTLAPGSPLVPGSRHVLRVEGITARELHDDAGRACAPSSFELLVAGTPPPPEPKKRPKRRRR